jgi:hypothetical protein
MRAACQRYAEARQRATDIARAEAVIRADAAWRDAYDRTFAHVYAQTLAELLDEPHDPYEAA